MFLINSKKEVKVSDASRVLGLDEKSLMDLAEILCNSRIIDVVYTISGDVLLKPGREFRRSIDDLSGVITEGLDYDIVKPEAKPAESNSYVDGFLSSVRKEIAVKKDKGGQSQ